MRKVARGEVSFASGFPVSTPERTIFELVADDEDPYLDDPAATPTCSWACRWPSSKPRVPTSSYSKGIGRKKAKAPVS